MIPVELPRVFNYFRYPDLTAVVVDHLTVCVAGEEIAVENGLEERISYHPASTPPS